MYQYKCVAGLKHQQKYGMMLIIHYTVHMYVCIYVRTAGYLLSMVCYDCLSKHPW